MFKTKAKSASASMKLAHYLELIDLIQRVGLLLEVGYDFSYAWRESYLYLKKSQRGIFLNWDENAETGFVQSYFHSLESINDPYLLFWLKHLVELYEQRGPMREAVLQFTEFLWAEVRKEMELFRKRLPMQLNVIIMVFFLPSFFLIIFFPLSKLLFSF